MLDRRDATNPLWLTVSRNVLRYAVGRQIFCRHNACDTLLDAEKAVLVTGPSGAWVGCISCWGRGPFLMDSGRWSVLDGRILFARQRSRRARKVGVAQ